MNKFNFRKKEIYLLATVGFASWYGGLYFERNKSRGFNNLLKRSSDPEKIRSFPGLPVFSTVSAATPISPSNNDERRIARIENRTSEIMQYGFPSLSCIRSYDDFVLSYDPKTRVANWVFEHLTFERLQPLNNVDRSKCEFSEDQSIHKYFRSSNKDYKKSGYDRGHLAAAGNHRLEHRHCQQTFLLTNIAPQVGVGFNRDAWNKLEKYVRKLTANHRNVYVCTGPLYLPRTEPDGKRYVKYEVIGNNDVAVPTHFFKIVVMETDKGELNLESYVMPNEPIENTISLKSFQVPPESVEMHSGLLFFDRLSKDRLVKVNGKNTT